LNPIDESIKVALTDFGSAERIFELLHDKAIVEFQSNRDDIADIAPTGWIRRDRVKIKPGIRLLIGSGRDKKVINELIEDCNRAKGSSSLVLDNWVNYPRRFDANPNCLVVTDPWARDYALNCWPTVKVEMKLIDRAHLRIEHSGKIARILVIGTPKNEYTIESLSRHKVDGSCACAEIHSIKKTFPNISIFFKPHPNVSFACSKIPSDVSILMKRTKLQNLADNKTIVVGRPSYAHYFFETIGIPAFFSEPVNQLWHGPKFRELNLIL
jgi:hypothetical protein